MIDNVSLTATLPLNPVTYQFQKELPEVDPGIIEVALAVAALAALMTTAQIPIPARILGAVTFLLGLFAASFYTALISSGEFLWPSRISIKPIATTTEKRLLAG